MTADGESPASPDEAFALLGNETRLAIVRALGEADGPTAFSALHDSVDVRDSGQFNYHLEKLVGHFVSKTAEGYLLTRAGRRVVEAILSGAVTDEPGLERTEVDAACYLCGAPVEVDWEAGSLKLYCTECAGNYRYFSGDEGLTAEEGYLGRMRLPPAGLEGRTSEEVLQAASFWSNLELLAMSAGICPRCSATVDYDRRVCDNHDASDGLCPECHGRHRIRLDVRCTNCIFDAGGDLTIALVARTPLLAFLIEHGINPVEPRTSHDFHRAVADYEETLLSTTPFRARFRFEIADDTLEVTVDEDLEIVEAARTPG